MAEERAAPGPDDDDDFDDDEDLDDPDLDDDEDLDEDEDDEDEDEDLDEDNDEEDDRIAEDDGGQVIRHPNLRLAYLRQHDPFYPGETVLAFLMRDSGQPDWKCGEVAGQFELKGATLEGPVAELSGGWQTRVKLAALLLHEPNLLLLDEPTNFLDLRTQILLEHFLKSHRSACLIVSHDRAFLGATCDSTLNLARGKLTTFPGKVDAFLEFQQEKRDHEERSNETILAKRR